MTTDPSTSVQIQLWAQYVTIANALISGLVAVLATWLAHIFAAKRESRKDHFNAETSRQEMLRDRLEKLVALVSRHCEQRLRAGHYVAMMGVHHAKGLPVPSQEAPMSDLEPLDEADALQLLYFPDLSQLFSDLHEANQVHLAFTYEETQQIGSDVKKWAAQSMPTFGTRNAQAAEQLLIHRRRLAQMARKILEGFR